MAQGVWPAGSTEAAGSSTEREVRAILLTLTSVTGDLKGQAMSIHCDNPEATSVLTQGSGVMTLQKLALKIFELCQQNRIQLFVQWIPRSLNTAAGTLSCIVC